MDAQDRFLSHRTLKVNSEIATLHFKETSRKGFRAESFARAVASDFIQKCKLKYG